MELINWPSILSGVLGFVFLLAFLLVGLSHYLRHLFYSKKFLFIIKMTDSQNQRYKLLSIGLWLLVCVAVISSSFIYHFDKMKPIIDLTPGEVSRLKKRVAKESILKWGNLTDKASLHSNVRPRIPGKVSLQGVVFLLENHAKNASSPFLKIKSRSWLKSSGLRAYYKSQHIPVKFCYWKQLKSCYLEGQVLIIPPGPWEIEKLDNLWRRGQSIWLLGYPSQMTSGPVKKWSWKGLKLAARSIRNSANGLTPGPAESILLRADQSITLGLDSGQLITSPGLYPNFRATTAAPQAYRTDAASPLSQGFSTALYSRSSKTLDGGRLVWSDFSPLRQTDSFGRPVNATQNKILLNLHQNIARFLSRTAHLHLATWPGGKTFAAFMAQDTEDGYANTINVVKMVRRNKFPITWFLLSDLALKHRNLTKKMASVGEMACHGDDHADFSPLSVLNQSLRIARCSKVILALTGREAVGFRPPREIFDVGLWAALSANAFNIAFVGHQWNRMTPQWKVQGRQRIIVIPRFNKDDFVLWDEEKLTPNQSLLVAKKEIARVEQLGGLYSFSFHSQFMHSADHLEIVEKIGLELQSKSTYFAEVQSIAHWWSLRSDILAGVRVSDEALRLYRPFILKTDRLGVVHKLPMTSSSNPFGINGNKPLPKVSLSIFKYRNKSGK